MANGTEQKDTRWLTTQYTENYMLSTMHPTKTRSELRCKERLPISCSTIGTLVFAKLAIKRKEGQGWE